MQVVSKEAGKIGLAEMQRNSENTNWKQGMDYGVKWGIN